MLQSTFSYISLLLLVLSSSCGSGSEGIQVPEPEENRYAFNNRIIWQQPGVVIDAMGDIEEKVVADIGAGEGFFVQQLVPLVDRVIAIEIDPRWINYLSDTLRQRYLPSNLRARLDVRLAKSDDPKLQPKEVDFVLFVNTLYEIDQPVRYLRQLLPVFKAGGRLVIVDWKKKNTSFGPEQDKRISLLELENLLQQAGYQVVNHDDTSLEYQYIVVAELRTEQQTD